MTGISEHDNPFSEPEPRSTPKSPRWELEREVKRSGLDPSSRLILLTLLTEMNGSACLGRWSLSWTGLKVTTGLSRRTVAGKVKELTAKGWLEAEPGTGRKKSVYTMKVPTGAATAPLPDSQPDANGATDAPLECNDCTTSGAVAAPLPDLPDLPDLPEQNLAHAREDSSLRSDTEPETDSPFGQIEVWPDYSQGSEPSAAEELKPPAPPDLQAVLDHLDRHYPDADGLFRSMVIHAAKNPDAPELAEFHRVVAEAVVDDMARSKVPDPSVAPVRSSDKYNPAVDAFDRRSAQSHSAATEPATLPEGPGSSSQARDTAPEPAMGAG